MERASIADLAPGFGVERRVVENDLALLPGLQLLHASVVAHEGDDFAVAGFRLAVAFENSGPELLIRGIRRLLGGTLPRCLRAGALLGHRMVEAILVEPDALVPGGVDDEIKREAEGVVEFEGFCTVYRRAFPSSFR